MPPIREGHLLWFNVDAEGLRAAVRLGAVELEFSAPLDEAQVKRLNNYAASRISYLLGEVVGEGIALHVVSSSARE
jgi:hypothetical protein